MSAQTKYGYFTVKGDAGGIYDLAPYTIDSFINEAATGKLKPGMAVVTGTKAGLQVKLPTAAGNTFEGVVTNRRTTEHGIEGEVTLRNKATVGVMRQGRIWALLADGIKPAYNGAAYVVATGDEAGCFTTASSGNIAINARFLSADEDGIALVELLGQDVV